VNFDGHVQHGGDNKKALSCYHKVAEVGGIADACAMTNLGDCHYHGRGARKDLAQARRWCDKARNAPGAEYAAGTIAGFSRSLA